MFNAKTGHLVSGHQRLSILDEQEGSLEYMVAVAVVNLSEKREKELAIFLNNPQAQGRFDKESFEKILADEDFELSEAGFTWADLEAEFGESLKNFPGGGSFAAEETAAAPSIEEIQAIKDRKKAVREENATNPSEDAAYYLPIAFLSTQEKRAWLQQNGHSPDAGYLNAAEVGWTVKAAAPEPEAPATPFDGKASA